MEVHLTPTMGTYIAQADMMSKSTFGFYVKFLKYSNKVFVIICQHVLFPDSDFANNIYYHNNIS